MEAGTECPFRGPPGLRLNVTGLLPYPQARPSRCSILELFFAWSSARAERSEGPSVARVCERQRDVKAWPSA